MISGDGDNRQRLSAIRPRPVPSRAVANIGRGYSWFVRFARFALPVVALVLVGLVIARLSAEPDETALPKSAITAESVRTTAGRIELEGASYQATDAAGNSYTLSADTVSRPDGATDTVVLKSPEADVRFPDKTWLSAKAGTARYDIAAGRVTFGDTVGVFYAGGYDMQVADLFVDLNARTARSASPVLARGPGLSLSARGILVAGGGDTVTFSGPVALHLTAKDEQP